MLPISDLHFAFCGIATVAATLGYACARRAALSLAPSSDFPNADVEAGTPSLKRKLDDADEHGVDAEEQPRPMKRNKTPSTDEEQEDDEWEIVVAPPSYEQATARQSEEVQDNSQEKLLNINQEQEPTPPAYSHHETSSLPDERGTSTTPPPSQTNPSPNEPETPPALPVTPHKPAVPTKIKSTGAFSAFSGSTSPFASYSIASGTSPFAVSGQAVKNTPAWRRDNKSEPDVFGQAGTVNALALSPNDAVPSMTSQSLSKTMGDFGASNEVKSLAKSSTCITGEEDETVDAELKGVKLFTKRGRKEFTDGMYGHIKILTQRSIPSNISNGKPQEIESETGSRTRLLFRRDPLGQVSMNVGLHPTVRCHFEAAENILRVILMEQVMGDRKSTEEDVVIYAIKPGRAGKADFESFAKMLCNHEALQSRVVTGLAAAGEAAAS